jgi:alpha-1,3-rhamnosyl/mannosyltransferase
VPDDDLPAYFAAADLFVLPTLLEGFGIPLVEAMTAGTAACVARRGSLPEVAADAALLFDPTDATDIARTMEQLLTDATLRERLVARGRQRATEFDWDRCTARVVQHIEEACAASS